MCTVVVRGTAGSPILMLALRDELTDREFDDPGPWWPVPSGFAALVLNRT